MAVIFRVLLLERHTPKHLQMQWCDQGLPPGPTSGKSWTGWRGQSGPRQRQLGWWLTHDCCQPASCVQVFIRKPLVSGTHTHFPCPLLPLIFFESCPQSWLKTHVKSIKHLFLHLTWPLSHARRVWPPSSPHIHSPSPPMPKSTQALILPNA